MGGEPSFFRNRFLRGGLDRFSNPLLDNANFGEQSQRSVANPFISHQPGTGRPINNTSRISNPFISHQPGTGRPVNNNSTPLVNPLISHQPGVGRPVNNASSFSNNLMASKNFKTSR